MRNLLQSEFFFKPSFLVLIEHRHSLASAYTFRGHRNTDVETTHDRLCDVTSWTRYANGDDCDNTQHASSRVSDRQMQMFINTSDHVIT